MILVELGILLGCILVGARLGGIALGTVSGIGLVIFVFAFGMPPGQPPAVVLGMILAVITALAAMEAAGGLRFLVETAERLLRRNPSRITFVAPVVTYLLIFGAGLAGYGVHELLEAGEHSGMDFWFFGEKPYDINPALNSDGSYPALHEKGIIGSILKALVGYDGNPEWLRIIVYLGYWIVIGTYLYKQYRPTD